ncbi:hypothetical protein KKH03_01225, partial [Patescibacteria group bacterium]|nr:hypothetical protein [Patescibacteria group bacterium]
MLFSLDVFEENLSFWEIALGLFIHNIPALILLIIVIISWKHELVGTIGFILAGIFYILLIFIGKVLMNGFDWLIALNWSGMIAGPAI